MRKILFTSFMGALLLSTVACNDTAHSVGQSGGQAGGGTLIWPQDTDSSGAGSGGSTGGQSASATGGTSGASSTDTNTTTGATFDTSLGGSITTAESTGMPADPCAVCGQGTYCEVDNGVATCLDIICQPGEQRCSDEHAFEFCNEHGTSFDSSSKCDAGQLCDPQVGACAPACDVIKNYPSSQGCEFWAVDLANVPPRDTFAYGVVMTNSNELPVQVAIYDKNGGMEQMLWQGVIPPQDSVTVPLSGKSVGLQGLYPGDAGFLGNGIAFGRAFRIEADQPITVAQFNPLQGPIGFTTDSSLLLPSHALGSEYTAAAWGEGLGTGSSLVVVATSDQTTVTITTTADTVAGKNSLPAIKKGVPTLVSLGQYDYVQLATASGDLSGSRIEADQPVAVFGGHSCGTVPDKSVDFCDHLEEQVFPLDLWGNHHVVPFAPKTVNEPTTWRVMAGPQGAKLNFASNPDLEGLNQELGPNEVLTFSADEGFVLDSDRSVSVTGYTPGCEVSGNPECLGDPAMFQVVPELRWATEYAFEAQPGYDQNMILVVRRVDQEIDFLCVEGTFGWSPLGDYEYATIHVGDDCAKQTNWAVSETPFSLTLFGKSAGNSYAHPGGLHTVFMNPA